ncbi:23734_t:CDS:2 [Dentiscutata erythropus]|uniref:23734_t:CDS:1 n=1 Tax=Dentiscutata erythropus TaxID=1348616 RepID=A0A9N9EWH9_9GLOM|nr:23734_t:CDS:2 [Dentiscutata erythropus]
MSNPTKGTEYVPIPTEVQVNLRFGMPGVVGSGVAENDSEQIFNYGITPEPDNEEVRVHDNEVRIHGEGISKADEDRNLAELKALVRERERHECKESEDNKPGAQSANLATALGKYANAVAQERSENPSDLTNSKHLPHVQIPDEKELLNRLNQEVKTRSRAEQLEMERTVKGGVAANVKSAADRIENDLKTHHK